LPESMLNLAAYGEICVAANKIGLESVDRKGGHVIFKSARTRRRACPNPRV